MISRGAQILIKRVKRSHKVAAREIYVRQSDKVQPGIMTAQMSLIVGAHEHRHTTSAASAQSYRQLTTATVTEMADKAQKQDEQPKKVRVRNLKRSCCLVRDRALLILYVEARSIKSALHSNSILCLSSWLIQAAAVLCKQLSKSGCNAIDHALAWNGAVFSLHDSAPLLRPHRPAIPQYNNSFSCWSMVHRMVYRAEVGSGHGFYSWFLSATGAACI